MRKGFKLFIIVLIVAVFVMLVAPVIPQLFQMM